MAPQYTIFIRDSAGAIVANLTAMIGVKISRVLNGFDIAQTVITGSDPNVSYIVYGARVEIFRRDIAAGVPNNREFAGVIYTTKTTINEVTTVSFVAVGFEVLLQNRIIAFFANVANRSVFTAQPAETVMKTLFNYNAGSLATTANARFLNGVITGATTAATSGAGNSISIAVAGQNLLTAMQRIQEIAGGDFAVIYTAPATYTFTWYTGQRGTDRTATVVFSTATGTIGQLDIEQSRINDFNAVIVAGAGNESARAIVTRPASLPTGFDLREQWIDARNGQTSTAALQNTGDLELGIATKNRVTYSAQILQTPAVRYGVEYFIGDLVSLYTGAGVVTQKINGVQISIDSMGREQIQIELISN
jgi:hypothetical protein